jgi:hypothetical protein
LNLLTAVSTVVKQRRFLFLNVTRVLRVWICLFFFGVGEWLVDWHILVAMAADDEWASWGASASREPSQNTLDALFD